MPKRYIPKKRQISRTVVNKLKKRGIKVSMVTDAPRGAHIFSRASKGDIRKALKDIAKEDKNKRFYVGKSSNKKIVLDPSEPNIAVPNSLSIKGKPYKKWKKV